MNKTWLVKEFSIELRGEAEHHLLILLRRGSMNHQEDSKSEIVYLRKPNNIVDPLSTLML